MIGRALTANLMRIRWARLAIIAGTTFFVGSFFLAPQFNPLASRWALKKTEEAMLVSNALAEVVYIQHLLDPLMPMESVDDSLMRDLFPPTGQPRFLRISISPPRQAILQLRSMGDLDEALLNDALIFTWQEQGRWSCEQRSGEWPDRLLPLECRRSAPLDAIGIMSWMLIACIALLLAMVAYLWWTHPLVRPLQNNPNALHRLPIGELPKADRALGWLRRRATLLGLAEVDLRDWKEAVDYLRQQPDRRARILASRLAAQCSETQGWNIDGSIFEWRFVHGLPITLDRVLIFFPDRQRDGRSLVQQLRTIQTGLDVMLVVLDEPAAEVMGYCRDTTNMFAALNPATQTELLIGPDPQAALVRMLSRQLMLTRISPYQTRGGITRSSGFFGREKILHRIVRREPSNFLVVGGRQLGKTSLLKAVERRLVDQPGTRCWYLSLRDHRLAPRLAVMLGMDATDDMETVLAHIETLSRDARLLFLIDEADPFMAHEAQSGFRQLAAMRALSDEGRCHFALAGFWELYAAAALDYHSPVRNFGEIITIGALEADACRDLATRPLSLLGLRFASEELVSRIVELSGGRANLIAIICQECLDQLDRDPMQIEFAHVDAALKSQPVADALSGWTRLSSSADDSRLDRIIVYKTTLHEGITVGQLLQDLTPGWTAQQVHASLQRLRLAYILKSKEGDMFFAVPLFADQMDATEARAYLAAELHEGNDSAGS